MSPSIAIDDPADPRLDPYRALKDRDRQPGKVLVEGPVACLRLLAERPFDSVLSLQAWTARLEGRIPPSTAWYVVDREVMAAVVGYDHHRGVLGVTDQPPWAGMTEILEATRAVVFEGVNDAENLGSAIRTAVGLGFGHFVLDPTTIDPWYRRVVRVSMGHGFGARFHRTVEWPEALSSLTTTGFTVVALTPTGRPIAGVSPPDRPALMVGAEGSGLSAEALAGAAIRVGIPMTPAVDSLNVGHALAIAAFWAGPAGRHR